MIDLKLFKAKTRLTHRKNTIKKDRTLTVKCGIIRRNFNANEQQIPMTNLTQFADFDLAPELLNALQKKGYQRPTAIQQETIPAAMEGFDILGSAPTGTGKTAAFLLPAIQHLLDYPRRKPGAPRVLILTPTRELAMQVAEQAEELACFTKLSIATITGGVAYQNHGEIFNKNQDIVVATPGRLLQYIKEENFDCRAVEILIFDEADRMLQMGFGQDAEKISAETRWRKQTLLFSATLEGDLLEDFADRTLRALYSYAVGKMCANWRKICVNAVFVARIWKAKWRKPNATTRLIN